MKPVTAREANADDLALLASWLGAQVPQLTLPDAPHEHLWVAQDAKGRALATLRLLPRIGLTLPRVSYHVGCVVHAAPELGLFHRQDTLLLGHDLTGACELSDWAHDPLLSAEEQTGAWQVLMAAALHQIRAEPKAFGTRLVVELPGTRDRAGQSPFWDGLGRHFYSGDPAAAQAAHGRAWVSQVAALLPRHPLLVAFLPESAQQAIAREQAASAPLRQVLEAAGLRHAQHVRVDDGGPVLEACVADVRV
jgi:arginine N-succinyltransferase